MAGRAVVLSPQTCMKVEKIRERFSGIQQKSKEWLHCGQWLRSGLVHYTGLDGKERVWEAVERTTTKGNIDGVDIIATMAEDGTGAAEAGRNQDNMICLVAVYRAPVNRVSVEFPAGLIDPGESLNHAAHRELVEETGYECVIKSVSPEVFIDPWKSTESTAICRAEVKTNSTGGVQQTLKLDEDEFLEPFELPLENLVGQLEYLQKEYGFVIEAKLYCFALGLQMATL